MKKGDLMPELDGANYQSASSNPNEQTGYQKSIKIPSETIFLNQPLDKDDFDKRFDSEQCNPIQAVYGVNGIELVGELALILIKSGYKVWAEVDMEDVTFTVYYQKV